MLTNTRFLLYVLGFLGSLAAAFGLADFDVATGMVKPHEFNLYSLGGIAMGTAVGLGTAGNLLAAVANALGWTVRKPK